MANLKDILNAQKNRQELIKAGLNRRDLFKMGLLTSAGYLVRKNGLSAWAFDGGCGPGICRLGFSPPIRPFLDPLPIIPVLPERPVTDPGLQFGAPPQICPNHNINPATGLTFEGRGFFNGVTRAPMRIVSSSSISIRRSTTLLNVRGKIRISGLPQMRQSPRRQFGDS